MSFNPIRAFNYLEDLSYPRFTGSSGEASAREYIKEKLQSFGYTPVLEDFRTKTFEIMKSKVEITNHELGEIPCSGIGFSGSTPEEGVEDDLIYVESGDRMLLPSKSGFIYLMSTRPNLETWKFLNKRKPSAIIVAESNPYRSLSHIGIPVEWEKYGRIPSVYIGFEDAIRLIRSDAKRARVTLVQKEFDTTSYNVVAEKRGYKYPDEIIVVGAHYDSVYDVPGSSDNAGGTAFVLELARVFSTIETKRTIRFVLFSGEELGLRGSLAYVDRHKEELENIKLIINLDVHGACIGTSSCIVTGTSELKTYVDSLAKELGIKINVKEDIMSSDGNSFAKHGIPAVNFFRSSGTGLDMHTIRDDKRFMWSTGYKLLGLFVESFLRRLANAEELPYKKEIPENLKKKVKEYFTERLGID